MENPHIIHIRCDGTMLYDSRQTGGMGCVIEFPDHMNQPPIETTFRLDGENIHQLETQAVIKGMESLLAFHKTNPDKIKPGTNVEVHTDRQSVSDSELSNPYKIREYRKNNWKDYEGEPIKNSRLLDKLDKTRRKLSNIISGRVDIVFTRRKQNKLADKLARQGRGQVLVDKSLLKSRASEVASKIFNNAEVKLTKLKEGDFFIAHTYYKSGVREQWEIRWEILEGKLKGRTLKSYVDLKDKIEIHRKRVYKIEIGRIFKHHTRIKSFKEISDSLKTYLS